MAPLTLEVGSMRMKTGGRRIWNIGDTTADVRAIDVLDTCVRIGSRRCRRRHRRRRRRCGNWLSVPHPGTLPSLAFILTCRCHRAIQLIS